MERNNVESFVSDFHSRLYLIISTGYKRTPCMELVADRLPRSPPPRLSDPRSMENSELVRAEDLGL